jgi:DNA helicase TIP49 (TBP-interacting protein)
MLNVERLNCWLNSNETRLVVNRIKEASEEIKEIVSDGTLLQEKSAEKISLDYTYALGQVEGLRMSIQLIKDISSILDEESEEESDGN